MEGPIDLLLRNGTVFDGRGTSPRRLDVGVRDGKVIAMQPSLTAVAKEVKDVSGMWVLPGFIDIHTHYDIEVEVAPGLSESVRHGVTSVVMGNCSLSVTYGEPGTLADMFLRVETLPRVLIEKWLDRSISWNDARGYLEHLGTLSLGPNTAALLGHSSLRAHVMGLERSLTERASEQEIAKMKALAEDALEAGLIGISIDMLPWHMMSGEHRGTAIPSHHASFREYKMLAEVCRSRDAVFQVTPNPQDARSFLAILAMSLSVLRSPLRVTVVAALDAVSCRPLWRLFPPLLFVFNRLLGSNIRFQTLTEPFTVYSDGPITPLFEEFPAGVELNNQETRNDRRKLWRTPSFRKRFRREWSSRRRRSFHRNLAEMTVVKSPDSSMVGKSFAQIARERKGDPVEEFMNLLEQFDTDIRWVSTGANDREWVRLKLLKSKHILPGFTDAGAHVRNLGYYDGALSLLRQAVSTNFIAPEVAIARVTGEPGEWFNLKRGTLEPGCPADIIVLDPQKLSGALLDQIEYQDPLLDGAPRMVKRGVDEIRAVYVNGKLAVSDGSLTEALGSEQLGSVISAREVRERRVDPRNRINREITSHPFLNYWDIFVLKHQDRRNIALHCIGMLVMYCIPVSALILQYPLILAFLPLSQVIGLLGHYLFERSHIDTRDAIFSLRAICALHKLFFTVIVGTYGQDLDRVRRLMAEHLSAVQHSSPPYDAAA